ncbi:MAG: ATP-binding protein [Pelagibacterales bacterium]|nr:ATP-binding protein [Pelagibacterales bacterium]
MLLRFSCENFLSFGEGKNAFQFVNLAVSKTKSLPSHYIDISAENSILRGAIIYGANASGKSNFIKAIEFARNLILQLDNVEKANLASRQNKFLKSKKSVFSFDFKVGEKIYEYGFAITTSEVVSEWLKSTNLNGKREKTLFERTGQKINDDKEIAAIVKKQKGGDFYKYAKKAVGANQLFLVRLKNDSVEGEVKEIIGWFKKIAFVREVNPVAYFKEKELLKFANNILTKVDHQIEQVELKESDIIRKAEDIPAVPKEIAENVIGHLEEFYKTKKKAASVVIGIQNKSSQLYLKINEEGEIRQSEILIRRKNIDFLLEQESDGIRKIFDLIPMLFASDSRNSSKQDAQSIFIVDEIERSLHPFVAKELIEMFFESGKKCETQLIFTTHDTNLLDLELMRKDEIWFSEKDENLNTHFTSLAEFKNIREDLVISRGYLQGRFGGIPFIKKKNLE